MSGPKDAIAPIVDERQLLRCIHCGFCLTACPTYSLRSDEADSPRGRIYFMRAMLEGRAELAPEIRLHLDRCLACYSCETACPSGIEYRHLIEDARAWILSRAPAAAPPGWRAFFRHILPSVRALRLLLLPLKIADALGLRAAVAAVARVLPLGWLGRALDLLPERIPGPGEPALPEVSPARGERRRRVGFVPGCVMEGMLPDLNRLLVEVLREVGCEVVVPRGQGCCGALARHEGEVERAARQADRLVRAFAGVDVECIVASAAGCGSTMRGYGGEPGDATEEFARRVRDFTEVVAEMIEARPPRNEVRMRVAYQEACHLSHGQRITAQPRRLLRAIPGLEVVELPEQEICCGSAGVYNLLQRRFSDELKERKAAHAMAAGVDAVVTANPGCLLQLGSALKRKTGAPRVYHLVELLAEAYGLSALAQEDVV